MVACSYNVNKFIVCYVEGKSGFFVPVKARETKKGKRPFTGKMLCCSDIHKLGDSQKVSEWVLFDVK